MEKYSKKAEQEKELHALLEQQMLKQKEKEVELIF